jgi:hypothetical protein
MSPLGLGGLQHYLEMQATTTMSLQGSCNSFLQNYSCLGVLIEGLRAIMSFYKGHPCNIGRFQMLKCSKTICKR